MSRANPGARGKAGMGSRSRKPKVTKVAVLIPAPLVLFQAGARFSLMLTSGKMPIEHGRRIDHVVELSLDHASGL